MCHFPLMICLAVVDLVDLGMLIIILNSVPLNSNVAEMLLNVDLSQFFFYG